VGKQLASGGRSRGRGKDKEKGRCTGQSFGIGLFVNNEGQSFVNVSICDI